MAENINLIPAKDLPIAEAEEVDVLCVENGELKRKPGASLGGGGGGYIINIPASDVKSSNDGNTEITLTESYDNFLPILLNGGSVWVYLGGLGIPYYLPLSLWAAMENTLMLAASVEGNMFAITCPNGTMALPTA